MSNYPYFGVPPPRKHRPVVDEPALDGKRVILSSPEGFIFDMRAVGELHTDGQGNLVVDILEETAFFESRFTDRAPRPVAWPAHLVWVD